MEWIHRKLSNRATLAIRENTNKRVLIYKLNFNELNDSTEKRLLSIWTKYNIHPFLYDGKRYYDLLFNEILNKI